MQSAETCYILNTGIHRSNTYFVSDIALTRIMSLSQGILTQLSSDDESVQLDGLNQLNELLAISMEDSLSVFPVEQLVPVLVSHTLPHASLLAPLVEGTSSWEAEDYLKRPNYLYCSRLLATQPWGS